MLHAARAAALAYSKDVDRFGCVVHAFQSAAEPGHGPADARCARRRRWPLAGTSVATIPVRCGGRRQLRSDYHPCDIH